MMLVCLEKSDLHMHVMTKRRNALNQASAQFSRKDFELARKGIDEGEAAHRVDIGGSL
jgi:hypothetical protein